MNVVHVITGLAQGGAEGALHRLVANSPTPSEHTIISLMNLGIHGQPLLDLGCKVFPLNMRSGRFSIIKFLKLVYLIRRCQPDVVQTWMYHADLLGGLAAKLLCIPVVWGIRRSDESLLDLGLSTWLVAKVCISFCRSIPCFIVSCSRRAIQTHRSFGYPNRFVYIPNGYLGPELFPEETVPTGFPARGNLEIVFGHVARFHPCKGHALFLQAFSQLHNMKFNALAVMVGANITVGNEKFRQIWEDWGNEAVTCLGSRNDVPNLMRGFDFLVMSSTGEGFPNVVCEAMLQGTPCVVTDVGDAAEIVGDTGWIVVDADVEALTRAMISAVQCTPTERRRRSDAARRRITEQYGIQRMVDSFYSVWQQAIDKSAA